VSADAAVAKRLEGLCWQQAQLNRPKQQQQRSRQCAHHPFLTPARTTPHETRDRMYMLIWLLTGLSSPNMMKPPIAPAIRWFTPDSEGSHSKATTRFGSAGIAAPGFKQRQHLSDARAATRSRSP
jgi:hypothetical protein